MVVFTCDGCGESVKKNQVDKHCGSCRRVSTFSCIDCSTTFYGNDYKTHIKCISEEEKYSAKGFVAKENKGEVKQAAWVDQVQSAINNTNVQDGALLRLLKEISQYSNIPRKEAKFIKFLQNSLRIRSYELASKAWRAISAAAVKPPPKQPTQPQPKSPAKEAFHTSTANSPTPEEGKQDGHRKRKSSPDGDKVAEGKKPKLEGEVNGTTGKETTDLTDQIQNGHPDLNSVVKKILKKTPDREMKVKKLRRMVSNEVEVECKDWFLAQLEELKRIKIDDSRKYVTFVSKKEKNKT